MTDSEIRYAMIVDGIRARWLGTLAVQRSDSFTDAMAFIERARAVMETPARRSARGDSSAEGNSAPARSLPLRP